VTSKNQLTLPKAVVREFPGIEYFAVAIRESEIVLSPVRIEARGVAQKRVREKIKKLGISSGDLEEAIRWARKASEK
jgi:hypothetical protein